MKYVEFGIKVKTFRDVPMCFPPGLTGFSCDLAELFWFGIFSGSHFHVRADSVAPSVTQPAVAADASLSCSLSSFGGEVEAEHCLFLRLRGPSRLWDSSKQPKEADFTWHAFFKPRAQPMSQWC